MLVCSDTKIDSDGDTLADSSEVFGFKQGGVTYKTDPSRMDTDGDGLGDNSDPNPLERIRLTGTNLSRVAILTSDSMTICNMQAERGAVNCKVNVTESAEFIRLVITAGQIVGDISVVNLRNLTDTLHFTGGFQRNDQLVDTLEIPVFPGSNTFNVRVTSDNNANYEMYYVNTVYGRLPQLKTWLLTSAALPADASYRVILDSLEHRNNSVTNVLIGHILSTSTSSPVQAHTELAYKVLAGDQVIIGQHTVKVDSVITVTGGALSAGRQVTVSGLAHSTFFNIIAQPFGPISGTTRFLYRNAETVKSITSQ
jgi:hypothetical protein